MTGISNGRIPQLSAMRQHLGLVVADKTWRQQLTLSTELGRGIAQRSA